MELSSEYLLTVLCFLGVLYAWRKFKQKQIRSPPGPWALPILGNVVQIGTRPHLTFLKWSKIYGPIFKVKLGSMNTVVIHDHKLLKKFFSDNASTGRLGDNPLFHEFSKGGYGLAHAEGAGWEEQRNFTVKTLKKIGFAKTSMETILLDEVLGLLEWFRKNEGKPVSGNRIFNAPVLNSIWRTVTGERCEWEKEEAPQQMLETTTEFICTANEITTNGLFFVPFLRFIAPGYFGWDRFLKGLNSMFEMFTESIRKHKETFDPDDLRDLIDHHLMEIKNTTDPNSSFYKEKGEENLMAGISDLFIAGSETTSATLSWALLYLGHNKEIQKKLQSEIDQVLGSELPSLPKRQEMPFTEATILEILRISSAVVLGVPHRMLADVTFQGYDIPKGTVIFVNHYGIHHDPDIWGDPENFRPDRFLNAEGTSVVRHDALVPFSEGKRKCIGGPMARDSMYLVLVSIFQKFYVSINGTPDFESQPGFLNAPKPFEFVMISREK